MCTFQSRIQSYNPKESNSVTQHTYTVKSHTHTIFAPRQAKTDTRKLWQNKPGPPPPPPPLEATATAMKNSSSSSLSSPPPEATSTVKSGLPEEVWRGVALFLPPKDVLSLLCVSRGIHDVGRGPLGAVLWKNLLIRDGHAHMAAACSAAVACNDDEDDAAAAMAKKTFLVQAHQQTLEAVKWYPISSPLQQRISDREGHLTCVWNDHYGDGDGDGGTNRLVVITGGFTDDDLVYALRPGSALDPTTQRRTWSWMRLMPVHQPSFCYGASLTALDGYPKILQDENGIAIRVWKAVRFGGFRAGGYSHETNQVTVLTITERVTVNDDDDAAEPWTVDWQIIPTKNSEVAAGRAYHTATLIGGRYLFVAGGMMWRGSILNEAILDTETWTWVNVPSITTSVGNGAKPSGRHGHSLVLDEKRNRCVLFGGGSGTDLLRSGVDNAEVWELQLGNNWSSNLDASFPWKWKKLHGNVHDGEEDAEVDEQDESDNNNGNVLTQVEALCLGRCHHGIKISSDNVILIFGSGRPSTNGMVVYELATDTFSKPGPAASGILPTPRFTGVAAYLEEGYVLCHGGYCTQESEAHGEMDVLDLAPGRRRGFERLPVDRNRRSYEPVTEGQLRRGGVNGDAAFQAMLGTLMETDVDQRQDVARQLLGQMAGPAMAGGRGMMLLQMIANGNAVIRGADEANDVNDAFLGDNSDDDDGMDSDYVDG